jgi:sugar O-acyltransferase (sialic acid O-acetyltransferase NeuD family)
MNTFLLGAANPETIRMIHAIHVRNPDFKVSGMLDNDASKHGTEFFGIPVLGGVERVRGLAGPDTRFVNLITGSTRARHSTTKAIVDAGGLLGNFIHPSVDLSMTRLGVGLYVQEAVVIQAAVQLSDNVSIHTGSVIGHETTIGQSSFVAHAVSVSGCCRIGDGTFIGTNATILPRRIIGRWATIGAGTVVTKDVPDFAVVVGNPGRVVRIDEPPEN